MSIKQDCIPKHDHEVVIEYTDGPDDMMRYSFTLYWLNDYANGKPEPTSVVVDGKRFFLRAQCFFADPDEYTKGYKSRVMAEKGYSVREVDSRFKKGGVK